MAVLLASDDSSVAAAAAAAAAAVVFHYRNPPLFRLTRNREREDERASELDGDLR